MMKDELIEKIIKLEHNIKETQTKWTEVNELSKDLKTDKDTKYKVYEELKKQLDLVHDHYLASKNNWQDSQDTLRQIEREGKNSKYELEKLKRELSRVEDAERIHQEYLDKVEAFRNKCLEAYWRKENRTDGLGAFEHQIEGAIHLAVAGQALLGDKRGLGKSLTSLIYADLKDAKKVLAIVPSDTMDNFIREIKLWAPHRSVIKIGKMSKGVRDFILPSLRDQTEYTLVFNYEAWRKDPIFIQDIVNLKADTLIYDEAHKSKTWGTVTCNGILDIRFGINVCPSCDNPVIAESGNIIDQYTCKSCHHEGFITEFCSIKNVLPMTGTPILNKPQELFPHLRMIAPELFKDQNTYLRDFCRKNISGHWVWQHRAEKELMEKIGPRYVARTRQSAGIIIPPATPVDHIITQDEFKENYPKQWRAYKDVKDYAELVLDPENEITMRMAYTIVVLMRLRQVLTWPAAIELKYKNEDGEEIVAAKLNVRESIKLDKAQELISEITEEGERVLGFSMFVDPLYELQRRLGNRAVCYTGDATGYKKNRIQLDFDPKTASAQPMWDILLGTYSAMGEGLNLNSATHEILIDRAWNPGKEEQAEGRIDRIGTTRDTYIHRIMVEGTIDTWMKNLIDTKKEIIGGFESQADLAQEVYRAIRDGDM